MVAAVENVPPVETPHSDLVAYLVAHRYVELGCDRWDSRKVLLLCAKFGETPAVMAARLRLRPSDFKMRMETDKWTKQDGLLLTILEREIDAIKGGIEPKRLFEKPAGGGA
jgi:hypothetical protein